MQTYHFALVAALLFAFGCRGSSNPPAGNNGGNGEPPPVVKNGNGGNHNTNNNHLTTDPGKIVSPTTDVSAEAEQVGKMDMPDLVATLGDEKLGPVATEELASRGSEAVQPLIAALDSDDATVKQRAIFTLGRLGPAAKEALPKLKAIADDSDDEVQSDAAKFAMDAIEGK